MYESLVRLDNDFQPNPHLAESWEPNEDASSWVFTLRQGVEFHDGSHHDGGRRRLVVARGDGPAERLESLRAAQGSAQAGEHHRRGRAHGPLRPGARFVFFPNPLGTRNSRIFKDGYTTEDFADERRSAPARSSYQSFVPGESFSSVRFENYWQEGKPLLDGIEVKNIPEAASKLEALLTGEVDLIDNIEYASSRALEGTDYEAAGAPRRGLARHDLRHARRAVHRSAGDHGDEDGARSAAGGRRRLRRVRLGRRRLR